MFHFYRQEGEDGEEEDNSVDVVDSGIHLEASSSTALDVDVDVDGDEETSGRFT